jgi:hypothetical protein
MGRPTKLTPRVRQAIVQAIAAGSTFRAAAEHAGVSDRTLRRSCSRPDGRATHASTPTRCTISYARSLPTAGLGRATHRTSRARTGANTCIGSDVVCMAATLGDDGVGGV